MWRLKTNGKKKLRKAIVRVDKVVIMDIRRQLEQSRKWKAEVVKRRANPSDTTIAAQDAVIATEATAKNQQEAKAK